MLIVLLKTMHFSSLAVSSRQISKGFWLKSNSMFAVKISSPVIDMFMVFFN